MNLQKMIKEAQKAQRKATEVQDRLAEMTVIGTAGGLVEVTATGQGRIVGLSLKPQAVDPEELEALEDLILVAVQDAQVKAHELSEKEMQQSLGSVGGMLGGFL